MSSSVIDKKTKVAEFLKMEVAPGFNYELINGKIVKKGAPSPKHQKASGKLFRLLGTFVEQKKLGEVLYAPLTYFSVNTIPCNQIYCLSAKHERRLLLMTV